MGAQKRVVTRLFGCGSQFEIPIVTIDLVVFDFDSFHFFCSMILSRSFHCSLFFIRVSLQVLPSNLHSDARCEQLIQPKTSSYWYRRTFYSKPELLFYHFHDI